MKRLILIFILAFAPALAAQSTTVSATVQDANAVVYGNGTVTAQFLPNPSYPFSTYTWTGGALSRTITGTTNSSGVFSISIPSNTAISPAGSSWNITSCDFNGFSCASAIISVAGTTQSISTQINANSQLVIPGSVIVNKVFGNGTPVTIYGSPNSSGNLLQIYDYLGNTLFSVSPAGAVTCVSGCSGGGGGGVTSVAQTVPSWLTVTGSPITTSGTLAITPTTAQTSHQVIGTCGTATTFTPCALVAGDLPAISLISGVGGILPVANGGTATASPALVPGQNIGITGTWPNQTIAETNVCPPNTTANTYLIGSATPGSCSGGSLTESSGTVTTTEPMSVGASLSTTANGTNPSADTFIGNTALPTLSTFGANVFAILGPPTTGFTSWSLQAGNTIPATTDLLSCTTTSSNCLLTDTGIPATATGFNTLIKTLTGCNTASNVYTPQGADCVAPASGGSGGGVVGYSGLPVVSATVYVPLMGDTVGSTTRTNVTWPAPSAAPISNLYAFSSSVPGTGNTLVVTLYDGATAEALTCTITAAANSCSDTNPAHAFTPVAGDLLSWQISPTGTVVITPNIQIGANWATPTSGSLSGMTSGQIAIAGGPTSITSSEANITAAQGPLGLVGMVTGSAYTNATTSFTNVTGLAMTLAASSNYAIECSLNYQVSATTAGPKLTFTGTGTPSAFRVSALFATNATTTVNQTGTASGTTYSVTLGTGAASATATDLLFLVNGGLVGNSGTGGTLQLQAEAGGTGTLTIQQGSYCKAQLVQ